MPDTPDARTDEIIVRDTLVEKEHFAVLIHRYEVRLTRYIRRLGVKRIEDIEDVLQNIFMNTYRNLNSFDTNLSFSSWIYRIAHNEAVSFFRRHSVRPEGNLVQDGDAVLELLQGEFDTTVVAETALNAALVSRALQALDAKYREVLILRYFEEREYKDISDILQLSMGSVATLLRRAKMQLQRELAHIR